MLISRNVAQPSENIYEEKLWRETGNTFGSPKDRCVLLRNGVRESEFLGQFWPAQSVPSSARSGLAVDHFELACCLRASLNLLQYILMLHTVATVLSSLNEKMALFRSHLTFYAPNFIAAVSIYRKN